jgi:uncharacterized surface protein with fasciclin (FAS1) repeats
MLGAGAAPVASKQFLSAVIADKGFGTLNKLVAHAGIKKMLDNKPADPGMTLFAPSDAAFEAAPRVTDFLLCPGNKDLLEQVLRYHVIDQTMSVQDIGRTQSGVLPTILQGSNINVDAPVGTEPKKWTLNDAKLLFEVEDEAGRTVKSDLIDVVTENGLIHGIDKVMIPPQLKGDLSSIPSPPCTARTQAPNDEAEAIKLSVGSRLRLFGLSLPLVIFLTFWTGWRF